MNIYFHKHQHKSTVNWYLGIESRLVQITIAQGSGTKQSWFNLQRSLDLK